MRIAYFVDVHDRFEAVADALETTGDTDLVVIGGDLTNAGTPDRAERAIIEWRALAPRVLAVAGNMDSPAIDARLAELGVSIAQTGVTIDGIGLFGLSAAPRSPLRTPYELDEDELARRIEVASAHVPLGSLRIFCPHAPPWGTRCDLLADGRHVGSEAVRAFVAREQPELVLCGHIHEARGSDTIGRSKIVNPGPAAAGHYALVDTEPELVVRLDGEAQQVAF